MVGRIPVLDVTPVVEHGRYPAKAVVGEAFPVTALVFREGHDQLGADVVLTGPDGVRRPPVRMRDAGTDVSRRKAIVAPDTEGAWTFHIESWSDPLATWLHDAGIKIRADVDVELMFTEGVLLLERLVKQVQGPDQEVVSAAIKALGDHTRPVEARLAVAESPELAEIFAEHPLRDMLTHEGPYPLQVDRQRALFSSWYEFFPRSEGARIDEDGTVHSGTFRTAMDRLDAVAAMGFDVVYLPPIHPIGEVNRKGKNNTLTPGPDDVGSPWAIGSKKGGHDAVHPGLGKLRDFDAFVKRARQLGLEVALDLALQAAPDHPWVKKHQEWFTTRADGSIAYAENPPKKYQDIYPVNFDNDPEGIYAEVLRIVLLWVEHGVTLFRVDNPHTKPVEFWEWLIAEVNRDHPEVIFLAEAFTRPAMMHTLAKVGFHQSYTYFAWRNTKAELTEYLTELSGDAADYMRPSFWPTTHDILTPYMQYGGRPAFRLRAVLAATMVPTYGIYTGYELVENVARPGVEEQIDNEKYEFKPRDWAAAEASGTSLAPLLSRLNHIRRRHPSLQRLRNITFHATDDDAVLCYSKRLTAAQSPTGREDTIIVVANLDPHGTRETTVHLSMPALGMDWHDGFVAHDLLSGQTWHWGEHVYVRLDPHADPAHVIHVRGV